MSAGLAQGYRGYAGFGTQTGAIGTGVAATKFQTIYPSVSVREERPGRQRFVGIRKDQNYHLANKGRIMTSGSISGPLIPDEAFFGYVIAMLMGNNNAVSGAGTTGYTHVFDQPTPATAANYPAYGSTIEVNVGGTADTLMRDFVGSFVNRYQLTGTQDGGQVDCAVDFVGRSETTGGTASSPTYSNVPTFESWMADVQVGASLAALSSVEIVDFGVNITNGTKMLPALNGRYPVDRSFGLFDAQLNFGMWFREDLTMYNYWKNETERAVRLKLTHTSLAGSSSGEYSIQFDFPRCIFVGDVPNLDSAEEIKHNVVMHALKDATAGYTVKITVVNSESGTYAV